MPEPPPAGAHPWLLRGDYSIDEFEKALKAPAAAPAASSTDDALASAIKRRFEAYAKGGESDG